MPKVAFKLYITLYFSLFWLNHTYSKKVDFTPKEIIFKMIKSIESVERLKYSLKITELEKKGQQLKVPNACAKDVTLFINQLYFLPIGIKILDDKGLYEQYEYHYLQVNQKLQDTYFTSKYKDYNF